MTDKLPRKKTIRKSDHDQDAALLATALKGVGITSFKSGSGITQPSDKQKIASLEAHIENMKQSRWELASAHGKDADKAISRLDSEISRAVLMIAQLKIGATQPD